MNFLQTMMAALAVRRVASVTNRGLVAFVPHARTTSSQLHVASKEIVERRDPAEAASKQKCDILLFDLDGTLYNGDNGMKEFMQQRIHQFLVQRTGKETGDPKFDQITTIDEARAVWEPLFAKYNQSLRGLLSAGYKIDATEFNAYFRDGTENFMVRDEQLRQVLHSLPQRKVIFTNAPEASAVKNMDRLGILDCFDGVYGAETMGTHCCKPEKEAFETVLRKAGVDINDPESCSRVCFFEDSYMNLVQGKNLGMHTVFVHCSTAEEEGKSKEEADDLFDAVIADVGTELRDAMPWLWEGGNEPNFIE